MESEKKQVPSPPAYGTPNYPPPQYGAPQQYDSGYQPAQAQPAATFVYAPANPVPVASQPPDYLVLSIFSILCCFWPLGVVAIIKSIETRRHCQEGRLAEAQASSKEAKTWNSLAIGIGIAINVIVWIFVIIFTIVPIVAVAAASNS